MGEILELAQKIDGDAHRWSNQDRVRIETDLTVAEYALLQTALRNAAVAFAAARPDREGLARVIDPEVFKLPRVNLYKADYERAYARADAVLALFNCEQ